MRKLGGIVLGTFYGLNAWLALVYALLGISPTPLGEHYIFLGGVWLTAVAIGSLLATEGWPERPVISALLTGVLLAFLVYLFVKVGLLPRQASPIVILTLAVACISGEAMRERRMDRESTTSGEIGVTKFVIFGIAWKHWLWLWLPMYGWLNRTPATLYYSWLNAALVVHREFHAGLWFDWGWDFSSGVANVLSDTALFVLFVGAALALESISMPDKPLAARLIRFFGWGIGLALLGNSLLLLMAEHLTDHLMAVTVPDRPWWQFF